MSAGAIKVKPIRTKKEYEQTMKTIESLLDCAQNSKEAELLDVLSILATELDKSVFFEALTNPKKPNKNLREAAKSYQQKVL